jgi:hypothetical protein
MAMARSGGVRENEERKEGVERKRKKQDRRKGKKDKIIRKRNGEKRII